MAKPSSIFEEGKDIDVDSVSYGFMASQAVFAGLEVGIYEALASAPLPLAEIQKKCNISAPRLQTLLTSLTAIKSLARDATGMYSLSPNSKRYLVRASKQFYGDYLRLQMGRLFYQRMGALPTVMTGGEAPNYEAWLGSAENADTYTKAQHNGSMATASYLVKKKLDLGMSKKMLDVGGGSGAFSYVFVEKTPGLNSTVLELPEVCKSGEAIKKGFSADVQSRVNFVELDVTKPTWPVQDGSFDLVVISYVSGSVPESVIKELYVNAYKALQPGGRLLVHDFMVNDSLDGPALGALWALQHVTVNSDGLGLCPKEIIGRMETAGFTGAQTMEMITGMTKVIIANKPAGKL
jgi:SAM-dependent methyltransferase